VERLLVWMPRKNIQEATIMRQRKLLTQAMIAWITGQMPHALVREIEDYLGRRRALRPKKKTS
jgi:3-methyladenine DNA glycosylase Mpg